MAKEKDKINLTESLEQLNAIVTWFDEQNEVDVEAGLEKVREAADLIKGSKKRLAEIENEFKEIEREIGQGIASVNDDEEVENSQSDDGDSVYFEGRL